MVNIKNLRQWESLDCQTVGYQGTLEIAHTALTTLHTSAEGVKGCGQKAIDACGNIAVVIILVKESGNVHRFIRTHIKGLLIIDEICDGECLNTRLAEGGHEISKLILAENGIHRGHHERPVAEVLADFKETIVTFFQKEQVLVGILFMILFCWLLVCEVPMFAFKGKLAWSKDKMKIIFLVLSFLFVSLGGFIFSDTSHWMGVCRGVAASVGLYVVLSIVASYLPKNEE